MSNKKSKKIRKMYRKTIAMVCSGDVMKELEYLTKRRNQYYWTAIIETGIIIGLLIFIFLR